MPWPAISTASRQTNRSPTLCCRPGETLLKGPLAPRGTVFGFVYSGLDLGSAMTPPFLGLLLDHHMPRLIFVLTAGILLLAIATAFVVGHKNTGRRFGPAGNLVASGS